MSRFLEHLRKLASLRGEMYKDILTTAAKKLDLLPDEKEAPPAEGVTPSASGAETATSQKEENKSSTEKRPA